MRVIAGTAGGRRLAAPPGRDVRPTSDRVREAMFSMLDARLGLEGLLVADLACGSGALGIEALSRGAVGCTFVDAAARSLDVARANVRAVGLGGEGVRFVRDDLLRFSRGLGADEVDLVLVDPPYAWDGWADLQGALVGKVAAICAESDREIAPAPGWTCPRARRHGGSVVSMLVPVEAS